MFLNVKSDQVADNKKAQKLGYSDLFDRPYEIATLSPIWCTRVDYIIFSFCLFVPLNAMKVVQEDL